MSKKRNDKESIICLTPKPNQSFSVYCIKSKEKNFYRKKKLFKEKGIVEDRTKNKKVAFKLLALKVGDKTVRTAIKQNLSPDLIPLDYTIWGVLENKTNATPHPNIGLLKTAFEEKWNKMAEEIVFRACESFWKRVDSILKEWWPYWVNVLCLSSCFVVYFL